MSKPARQCAACDAALTSDDDDLCPPCRALRREFCDHVIDALIAHVESLPVPAEKAARD